MTGKDGDLTLLPGNQITLTRDMEFNSLSMYSTSKIYLNGYRIFTKTLYILPDEDGVVDLTCLPIFNQDGQTVKLNNLPVFDKKEES